MYRRRRRGKANRYTFAGRERRVRSEEHVLRGSTRVPRANSLRINLTAVRRAIIANTVNTVAVKRNRRNRAASDEAREKESKEKAEEVRTFALHCGAEKTRLLRRTVRDCESCVRCDVTRAPSRAPEDSSSYYLDATPRLTYRRIRFSLTHPRVRFPHGGNAPRDFLVSSPRRALVTL